MIGVRGALFLAACAAAGCAGKQSWEEISSEVYVHSLPSGARVSVEGKGMGTTPVSVPIPAGEPAAGGSTKPAVVTAELEGFAPSNATLDRRALPQEIVIVLAPVIAGEEPRPPPGWADAPALQETGARLAAADRCAHALPYFARAIEIDRRAPIALREGGRCHARLGNRGPASELLGRYLMSHSEAKDARAVRAELDAIDRGRTIDLEGVP